MLTTSRTAGRPPWPPPLEGARPRRRTEEDPAIRCGTMTDTRTGSGAVMPIADILEDR
jgi:hypothetical protein